MSPARLTLPGTFYLFAIVTGTIICAWSKAGSILLVFYILDHLLTCYNRHIS